MLLLDQTFRFLARVLQDNHQRLWPLDFHLGQLFQLRNFCHSLTTPLSTCFLVTTKRRLLRCQSMGHQPLSTNKCCALKLISNRPNRAANSNSEMDLFGTVKTNFDFQSSVVFGLSLYKTLAVVFIELISWCHFFWSTAFQAKSPDKQPYGFKAWVWKAFLWELTSICHGNPGPHPKGLSFGDHLAWVGQVGEAQSLS